MDYEMNSHKKAQRGKAATNRSADRRVRHWGADLSAPTQQAARPHRSADIPVGFAGAEFLISFILPFAPIRADVAACLIRLPQLFTAGSGELGEALLTIG
jgi:hypothetical protein